MPKKVVDQARRHLDIDFALSFPLFFFDIHPKTFRDTFAGVAAVVPCLIHETVHFATIAASCLRISPQSLLHTPGRHLTW